MAAKKLLLILMIGLFQVNGVLAGETVLKGTASCVMPDLTGLEAPATIQETSAQGPDATPVLADASKDYEVQNEEKLIQTQTEQEEAVTVYTVCAK